MHGGFEGIGMKGRRSKKLLEKCRFRLTKSSNVVGLMVLITAPRRAAGAFVFLGASLDFSASNLAPDLGGNFQ